MLKFTYGVMGCSKSAQALITRYNYAQNGFVVMLLKPSIDTRFDDETRMIRSRIGLSSECITFTMESDLTHLLSHVINLKAIVIVDEVQFCTKQQIEQLKEISSKIDVFCYGLSTNFKTELFEGSKRLFELADKLEKLPHICNCGNQALLNIRFKNDMICIDGEEIQIGDEEYKPMCYECYLRQLKH